MRITRDALLKLARDTVTKRLAPDSNVIAVFLVGSVLHEPAFLGSTTDIDLLVIYDGPPLREREVIKLSNEIHIDIFYEDTALYAQPRELRSDPWRGFTMWDPLLLHEKTKFFEYTQAIVRSQFDDPLNLLNRARAFANPARTAWNDMQFSDGDIPIADYLAALEKAVNAVAVLTGAPLPERRLLAEFPARAQAAGLDDLSSLLLTALGALQTNPDLLRGWLPAWEAAFSFVAENHLDARLHAARLGYYKGAIDEYLSGDFPLSALWPLLSTWVRAAGLVEFEAEHKANWTEVCSTLGLTPARIAARLDTLDQFLDAVEEKLEQIASENGLEPQM